MKRPAGSKNPERKSYGGVTKAIGKAAKAVGKGAYFMSGLKMFDNGAKPGGMPKKGASGSQFKSFPGKQGATKKKKKKVSPNSTKKTVNKPKNKF